MESFAPADARLAARLPDGVLRPVAPHYLEEPRGRYQGRAGLIAAPRDVGECAAVIRACAAARVAVVPRGGGTGLVAGAVWPKDGPPPLVLSLERMQALRAVYPEENALVIEAGASLQAARQAAEAAGRLFPLSLASQGSAQIGGVLSTNAGGVNVLRWGNARDLVLGLEAVLPDGQIFHGLKRLRKDNTGYDLRHLLIGAEGTLGVITAASLRLVAPPAGIGTAMLRVSGPQAALALLAHANARFAGCVSAFELISGQGLRFLQEAAIPFHPPFARPADWLVLIELGLPAGIAPETALEQLFETALTEGLSDDGVIASSEAQRARLWQIREDIPLANRAVGAIASHDISLPLSEIPGFIRAASARLAQMGDMRLNCFGHLGDGNLHFNLFPAPGRQREDYEDRRAGLIELVHDMVHARGGSISAEHGVGRLKTGDLARYGDPARLAAMRAIKAALDPAGIMNPGAVLPEKSA